jgi:hypothetical protein
VDALAEAHVGEQALAAGVRLEREAGSHASGDASSARSRRSAGTGNSTK